MTINSLYTNSLFGGNNNSWLNPVQSNNWMQNLLRPGNSQRQNGGLSSAGAREFMGAVKSFGENMRKATSALLPSNNSIFKQMMGSSGNKDIMSVSVIDQKKAGNFKDKTKNVSIQQLASSQRNTGDSLNASAISSAQSGTNRFSIQRDDGKSFQFSVDIRSTDSNRTVQQKMADAINKQNTGVTASVQYDDKTKKSALVLSSNDTGAQKGFTITDTQGNAAAATGAGNKTQDARDALYTVDGEAKSSDKNTVDLGDGLSATFKQTTAAEIKAGVTQDRIGATNAIRDVVNNFNKMLEAARDSNSDKNAKGLQQRLESLASSYSGSLKNIGISRNKDGYLQIDEKKMETAFENNVVERALGNNTGGFAQRLNQLAKSAEANPGQFLTVQSRNNMLDTSGSMPSYLTAYQTNRIDHWNSMSMLFDMGV